MRPQDEVSCHSLTLILHRFTENFEILLTFGGSELVLVDLELVLWVWTSESDPTPGGSVSLENEGGEDVLGIGRIVGVTGVVSYIREIEI